MRLFRNLLFGLCGVLTVVSCSNDASSSESDGDTAISVTVVSQSTYRVSFSDPDLILDCSLTDAGDRREEGEVISAKGLGIPLYIHIHGVQGSLQLSIDGVAQNLNSGSCGKSGDLSCTKITLYPRRNVRIEFSGGL